MVELKPIIVTNTLPMVDTPVRPQSKRVFTEDEWQFLQTRSTKDLLQRIERGNTLIALLCSPQMMNMTPKEADYLSSNLRYQIEAINSIIEARSK